MNIYLAGAAFCIGLCIGELTLRRDETEPLLLLFILSFALAASSWLGAGAMLAFLILGRKNDG